MPDTGFIPWSVFGLIATATVFAVMFAIGVAMEVRDLRWAASQPALVLRSLVSVLVIVPVVAIAIAQALGVSFEAQVGIALMAISPGAPVALRRSLDAGGHHSFAAVLQLLVASLAVATMPLSILALNAFHGTHGQVAAGVVLKQVLIAQLFPLSLGLMIRRVWPAAATRLEPAMRQLAGVMLAAFAVVVLASIWRLVFAAGVVLSAGVVAITAAALIIGHLLGGPLEETRTAVAISSALRNPGLALLVATSNGAPPGVSATIFAYLIWAAVTVTVYIAVRRRA
jgi:BASS family bile acid:Na+ symporter